MNENKKLNPKKIEKYRGNKKENVDYCRGNKLFVFP